MPSLSDRLKSWIVMQLHQWPEGTPLISGNVRWGTRLEDGTIVGAPGINLSFTPLPICSRCQQAIEADHQKEQCQRRSSMTKKTKRSIYDEVFGDHEPLMVILRRRQGRPMTPEEEEKYRDGLYGHAIETVDAIEAMADKLANPSTEH